MKVLICHNVYAQEGGENLVVRGEISLLRRAGVEVQEFLADSAEIAGYSAFRKLLFPFNTFFSIQQYLRLRREIKRTRPDVVEVHNVFPLLSPSVYVGAILHGVPIVQVVHNYRFLCINGILFTHGKVCERCKGGNYLHGIRYKCFRDSYHLSTLYALVMQFYRAIGLWHRIDLFVALSPFAKSKMVEGGISADKIVVRPNTVPAKDKIPSTEYGDFALFLGRLSNEKGIETLAKAFQICSNRKLTIAGSGPALDEVMNSIAHMPNVEFAGNVEGGTKEMLLAKCRFVIVPSIWYETFGLVVLEAFQYSKAVIASRIGSLESLVGEDGAGFLFEAGNELQLASLIERLFTDDDLCRQAGQSARKRYLSQFTPEQFVLNQIAILEKASEQHSSRFSS